jgi:hypothetical protein
MPPKSLAGGDCHNKSCPCAKLKIRSSNRSQPKKDQKYKQKMFLGSLKGGRMLRHTTRKHIKEKSLPSGSLYAFLIII